MDLLRVQDTLKNASDQQLVQMMQAPDSTAPSYLVLSEIRRRKDMRAKQVPEGASNRTVAEDLTAPESQGIRDMQMPEQAPPVADDQAGIEAMREDGVVRMQAGGPVMAMGANDPVIFGRPLSSYSLAELEQLTQGRAIRGIAPLGPAGAVRRFDEETGEPIPGSQELIRRRIASLRSRTEQPFPEEEPIREVAPLPQPAGIREIAPESTIAEPLMPSQAEPSRPMPPPVTPPSAPTQGPAVAEGQNQPRPAAATAQPRSGPVAQQSQGIGDLRAPQPEGSEPGPSGVQFTDRLSPLFERLQEGRVDPATRRNEALNMALIEAGLRIAGSRNPSLMGAIGEGALPAVQSYGQQLGQIRTDQRADLRDELQAALVQNQNDYQRGRLSQQQYATNQQMIIARMNQEGLNRRSAMAAGRAPERITYAQYQAMSPEERNLFDRFRGRPSTGAQGEPTPYQAAQLEQRRAQALLDTGNRSSARMALIQSGITRPTAEQIDEWITSRISPAPRTQAGTGATGGTSLPSGARIENGRYIPAGS